MDNKTKKKKKNFKIFERMIVDNTGSVSFRLFDLDGHCMSLEGICTDQLYTKLNENSHFVGSRKQFYLLISLDILKPILLA